MSKHHESHPDYGALGIFAGYGELEMNIDKLADRIASGIHSDLKAGRIQKADIDTVRHAVYAELDKQIRDLTLQAYDTEILINLTLRKLVCKCV